MPGNVPGLAHWGADRIFDVAPVFANHAPEIAPMYPRNVAYSAGRYRTT